MRYFFAAFALLFLCAGVHRTTAADDGTCRINPTSVLGTAVSLDVPQGTLLYMGVERLTAGDVECVVSVDQYGGVGFMPVDFAGVSDGRVIPGWLPGSMVGTALLGVPSLYRTTIPVSVNTGYSSAVVGDVDGDETVETVLARSSGGVVVASMTTSGLIVEHVGSLPTSPAYELASNTYRARTFADMDGDGHEDVVMAYVYGSTWQIKWIKNPGAPAALPNTAELMFSLTFSTSIGDIECVDVDLDGFKDVVWTSRHYTGGERQFYIRYAVGPAQFTSARPLVEVFVPGTTYTNYVGGPTIVDLDGDGDLDFVLAMASMDSVWLENTVNGAGEFAFSGTNTIVLSDPDPATSKFVAVNEDGDSDMDLLVCTGGTRGLDYLRNDGGGAFTVTTLLASGAYAPVAGDVNGDGAKDVCVMQSSLVMCAMFNMSTLTYEAATPVASMPTLSAASSSIDLADLNGDGWLDIVASDANRAFVVFHLGNASVLYGQSGAVVRNHYHMVMTQLVAGWDTTYPIITGRPAWTLDWNGDGVSEVLLEPRFGQMIEVVGVTPVSSGGLPRWEVTSLVTSAYMTSSSLALVDGDDDGDMDIMALATFSLVFLEQLGVGTGTFSSTQTGNFLPGGSGQVFDIVVGPERAGYGTGGLGAGFVVGYRSSTSGVSQLKHVLITNLASVTSEVTTLLSTISASALSTALCKLDGSSSEPSLLISAGSKVYELAGNTTATQLSEAVFEHIVDGQATAVTRLKCTDADLDGVDDLVLTSSSSSYVSFATESRRWGVPHVVPAAAYNFADYVPHVVPVNYTNGMRGMLDLVVATNSNQLQLAVAPHPAYNWWYRPSMYAGATGLSCTGTAVADFTGNGEMDAVCLASTMLGFFDGTSGPMFTSSTTVTGREVVGLASGSFYNLLAIDATRDGLLDLLWRDASILAVAANTGDPDNMFAVSALSTMPWAPCRQLSTSQSLFVRAVNGSTWPSLFCLSTNDDLYVMRPRLELSGFPFSAPELLAPNPHWASAIIRTGRFGRVTSSSSEEDFVFATTRQLGYFPGSSSSAVLLRVLPSTGFLVEQSGFLDVNGDGFLDWVGLGLIDGIDALGYWFGPGYLEAQHVNITRSTRSPMWLNSPGTRFESSYEFTVADVDLDGVEDVIYIENGANLPRALSQVLLTDQNAANPWNHLVPTSTRYSERSWYSPIVDVMDINGDGSHDYIPQSAFFTAGRTPYKARLGRTWVVPVERCGRTLGCVAQTLRLASKCVGDTVRVPGGTYTGCGVLAPIALGRSVTIEPVPGTGAVVFDCNGPEAMPSGIGGKFGFHVIGEGITVTMRDMTLTNMVSDTATFGGAAVTVTGASLVLERVLIANATTLASSTTSAESPPIGYGAGILVREGGSVTLVNSTVRGCSSSIGGGAIAVIGKSTSLSLMGSLLEDNTASSRGGAVFFEVVSQTSTLTISGTTIRDNTATGKLSDATPTSSGGAVSVVVLGGSLTMVVDGDSVFEANTVLTDGGALSVRATQASDTSLKLGAAVFRGNAAGRHGGGMCLDFVDVATATTTMTSGTTVVFDGNSAGSSGGGVAVLSTPPLLLPVTASPVVRMTGAGGMVFSGNSAGYHGGGVGVLVSNGVLAAAMPVELLMASATFVGNEARRMGGALAVLGRGRVDLSGTAMLTDNRGVFGVLASGPDASYLSGTVGPTGFNVEASAASLEPEPASVAAIPCGSRGVIATTGAVVGSGNGAVYGGFGFACGSLLQLNGVSSSLFDATTSTATAVPGVGPSVGGFVYTCVPDGNVPCGSTTHGCCTSQDVPFVSFDGSTSAALNATAAARAAVFESAATVGSAPKTVAWVQDPPSAVSSGVALGAGLVQVLDYFEQPVVDVNIALELTVTSANADGVAVVAGSRTQLLTSNPVSYRELGIALRDGTPTGSLVDVSVTIGKWAVPPSSALYSTAEATIELTACGPGAGARLNADPGVIECESCPEASFSNSTSLRPCEPCPGTSLLSGVGSTRCVSCPTGTTPVPGTLDPNSELGVNCTCLPQFYSASGMDNEACEACPEGGVCLGGRATPTAAPGFFPSEVANEFVRCKRESACVGGTQLCAEGYRGYLCNVCSTGYFSDASGGCSKCSDKSTILFGLFVFLVVGLGLVMLVIVMVSLWRASNNATVTTEEGRPLRLMPATVSMSIVTFQIVAVIADANVSWNSTARSTLGIFDVFNLKLALFESECVLESFYTSYATSILFPFLIMVTMFVGSLIVKMLALDSMPSFSLVQVMETAAFMFGPVLYIPLSRSTLVFFDCSRLPDGSFVLDENPGVECFDDEWVRWLGLALAGILMYVVGMPLYFARVLIRHRDSLFEPDVVLRYSPLFRLYRSTVYYGEVLVLAKRLSLVMVATFFSNHQLVQIAGILLILGFSQVVLVSAHPYFYEIYNRTELRLGGVTILLALLAMASYAERSSGGSADVFFIVAAVCLVIALFVLAFVSVALEVRDIIRERNGSVNNASVQRAKLIRQIRRILPDLDTEFQADVGILLNKFEDSQARSGAARKTTEAIDLEVLDDELRLDFLVE